MWQGMVGIAVVGYGYLGWNLVRNFNNAEGAQTIAICDSDSEKLHSLGAATPA
jgi:predicted dehydrogenase